MARLRRPSPGEIAAASAIPDQSGRTWMITGATHGVGLEVARVAVHAGARIVLPARDPVRAEEVARQVGGDIRTVPCDLADQTGVRRAAALAREALAGDPIDVLVNAAGAVTPTRQETVDRHERILAGNFLGPFALTNLVADLVRERIVIVGSNAHRTAPLDLDDPHFRHRRWSVDAAYRHSKLLDMLWGLDLQRRLTARRQGVDVQLAHPGWALTNIQNATGRPRLDAAITGLCRVFAQSAAAGALPVLAAATRELPGCSYLGPDGPGALRGLPTLLGRSVVAADPGAARRVWAFGVRETGTDLPI